MGTHVQMQASITLNPGGFCVTRVIVIVLTTPE